MSVSAPVRLASPSGLVAQVNANGSIRRMDHADVMINLFLANELEGGPANLFLRRRVPATGPTSEAISWIPLLGPRSPSEVRLDEHGLEITGVWSGLRYCVSLRFAHRAPAWFWHVDLTNTGSGVETVDLVHAQDLGLADYGAVRLNEYYVSQYVDHTPLPHPGKGIVLAARQNLSIGGRHPWVVIGSLGRATSFATDALQLYGLATRTGGAPAGLEAEDLPGERRQHEHSMAVVQDAPVRLAPGADARLGFFGWLEPNHPSASSPDDLVFVDRALALPEAVPENARPVAAGARRAATLFSARPLVAASELDEGELTAHFGAERREVERDDKRVLSFFCGEHAHVVLAAKERASLRPHGQILRSGERLVPDEASLTTTVWMGGVFHSMLTQGHVSINRFLSTVRGYLGLFRSHGQRIFVEQDGGWRLLDVPSAFEMTPSGARWLYKHAGGVIEVRSWAAVERHELWLAVKVVAGSPSRFLISHHVAANGDDGSDAVPVPFTRDARGIAVGLLPDTDLGRRFPAGGFRIDPTLETALEHVGGDELLFEDGRSRGQPHLVLVTAPLTSLALRITGQLVAPAPAEPARDTRAADARAASRFWRRMTGELSLHGPAGQRDVARLGEILPWLAHDALIHYLAPRGLEQYSGGGWGTRDVCQGPLEWLLACGHVEPVRDLLLRVFRNQNPDGDWPQWFMFYARERAIRPGDSHGDIVFWPLLALAQYLLHSDDAVLLDEELPFFHPAGEADAERATLLAHVERALGLIERRVIPGTRLAVYGHGDWNDALQPVDGALAERLCSAWTVTLHHQTGALLAEALRRCGRERLAASLEAALAGIRDDFQRLLVADGVVAGLAHFREDGGVEHWLHPRDRERGVAYSLLPMIHAILANLFSREQAEHHVALIRRHLLGVDGARLFDRPFPYRGGVQRRFQRAETSSFFGREMGLMYTHAHLRWAEALAHLGHAEAFLAALCQVNPVGLRDAVPCARLRQANCYTSSSDAVFRDRYRASERYDDVRTGAVDFEGGWRVFSSGPGTALRLVRERLLGLRLGRSELGIDPVLPRALDGLCAELELEGRKVAVTWRVGPRGHGPRALILNGEPLPFTREPNPYRTGGACVAMDVVRERLGDGLGPPGGGNRLQIELG
jgi:cellobiose phosphorylase